MGLKEVIADPRFQNADPEKQSAVLKRLGASDEFINKYIESGVRKPLAQGAAQGWEGQQLSDVPRALGGGADRPPSWSEIYSTMGSGNLEGLPSEAKGSIEGNAMALGGELVGPALGGLRVAAAARPALSGAVLGAAPKLMRGDIPGAIEHGIYGAAGMYGMGKLAKIYKALKTLGLMGGAAEEAVPGAMSQAEMLTAVRGASGASEGFVANPAAEEVAAQMIPRGAQAPLTRAEMAAAVKGATGAQTPVSTVGREMVTNATPQLTRADAAAAIRGAAGRETPIAEVGREMTSAATVKPFTQGEAGSVVRGIGKSPEGFVENPSPEMVSKMMKPAGGEAKLVSDLVEAGFSPDKAREIAANIALKGLKPTVSSAEIQGIPYLPEAPAAAPAATKAATLAERQAELLGGQSNPFAVQTPQYFKGSRLTPEEIKTMLEEMGHGVP